MNKQCSWCKELKNESLFYKSRTTKSGLTSRCKKCTDITVKMWIRTPDGKIREKGYGVKYRRKIRERIIKKMGGKCVQCGFSDMRALQLDHVNGGGNLIRKKMKNTMKYYQEIGDTLFKKEIQLLCANCNVIKRIVNKEHGGWFRPLKEIEL